MNVATKIFAAVAGAALLATSALASQPVRPAPASITASKVGLSLGARVGAPVSKSSNLAGAGTGYALLGLVAVGAAVGIATASGGHSHSVSP
jgi:hypothetical protein